MTQILFSLVLMAALVFAMVRWNAQNDTSVTSRPDPEMEDLRERIAVHMRCLCFPYDNHRTGTQIARAMEQASTTPHSDALVHTALDTLVRYGVLHTQVIGKGRQASRVYRYNHNGHVNPSTLQTRVVAHTSPLQGEPA